MTGTTSRSQTLITKTHNQSQKMLAGEYVILNMSWFIAMTPLHSW